MYVLFNIAVDDVSSRKGYFRQKVKEPLHSVKNKGTYHMETKRFRTELT